MNAFRFPIAAVLLCGVLLPAAGMGRGEQPLTGVAGNLLRHPARAPDFTLTDQHGTTFHMADTRGKVVLMTFIYTHCEDTCPFLAIKVKDAYDLLGLDARDVVIVAVTTDPRRDVPQVTAAYSRELGLYDVWHFVGGPAGAVQAVWADYGIGVTVDPDTGAAASSQKDVAPTLPTESHDQPIEGLTPVNLVLAEHLIQRCGGGYDVGHSAPFWIVDKRGIVRIGMADSATPSDIAANVRVLLNLN